MQSTPKVRFSGVTASLYNTQSTNESSTVFDKSKETYESQFAYMHSTKFEKFELLEVGPQELIHADPNP